MRTHALRRDRNSTQYIKEQLLIQTFKVHLGVLDILVELDLTNKYIPRNEYLTILEQKCDLHFKIILLFFFY